MLELVDTFDVLPAKKPNIEVAIRKWSQNNSNVVFMNQPNNI